MTGSRLALLAVVVAIGGVPGAAGAEPPPPLLTLHNAVEIATSGNHQLRAADASVDAAEAVVTQSRSGRHPRVDFLETFSRTTNPVFVFGNKLNQGVFGPDDFNFDTLNSPDPLNNFQSMLTVKYPLYMGGKVAGGMEAANYSHEAAQSERERTRQEIIYRVVETYSGAVLSASHLRVAREALATARANVSMVGDLRDAGLVVESDLLQARVRQSEVEEMVIRAESAVEVAHAAINLTLGRHLDTPFSLPEEFELAEPPASPLETLVEESQTNRPDLEAAERQALAAEKNIRMQRSTRRPEVGIEGWMQANSENFIEDYGTSWAVFVGARIPIWDGKETRGRVRKAEAEARRAQQMRDLLRESVGLETRRAFHDLRASRKSLDQARQAVELAGEGLRMVQDRYREGLATLVELLDAETALTRARTREVGTQRELLLNHATLDLATGRL